MILSYDFFAHIKSVGSMVDGCLFLEIPTSLTYLRITPSRQAHHFDINALVQRLNSHIPYYLFHSCHLLYLMYQYRYLPIVWEVI